MRLSAFLLLSTAFVWACGPGRGGDGHTTPIGVEVPERIDASNAADSLRLYHGLPRDARGREGLRAALVDYFNREAGPIAESDDLDAIAQHVVTLIDLFTPDDLERGNVPDSLAPLARALVEKGQRLGREGRVLAGLRILRAIEDSDALQAEYAEVATWGRDARANLSTGFERYSELIEVWDEHARLSPAPEVLHTLAELHVQRRDAIVEAFREGAQMMLRMGPLTNQVMRLAPLDVAAVYLRHGDLASAITHIRAMGDGGETEERLLRVLDRARGSDELAADALVELGEAYREVRPATGRGVCREGARRFREDARFPTCLARLAAQEGIYVGHSTGANVAGAVQVAKRLIAKGEEGCVVTIAADRGDRYLSSDLFG